MLRAAPAREHGHPQADDLAHVDPGPPAQLGSLGPDLSTAIDTVEPRGAVGPFGDCDWTMLFWLGSQTTCCVTETTKPALLEVVLGLAGASRR